jgi:hypothetical protein
MENELRRAVYKLQSAIQNFDNLEEMSGEFYRGALKRKAKKFFEFYSHHLSVNLEELYDDREFKQTSWVVHQNLDNLSCKGRNEEQEQLALFLAKVLSALDDLFATEDGPRKDLVIRPLIVRLKTLTGQSLMEKLPFKYEALIPYVEQYALG